jgi:hypothetical protein
MEWCGKHISAAVNERTTGTMQAVFSMQSNPRLYSEDHQLSQASLELHCYIPLPSND